MFMCFFLSSAKRTYHLANTPCVVCVCVIMVWSDMQCLAVWNFFFGPHLHVCKCRRTHEWHHLQELSGSMVLHSVEARHAGVQLESHIVIGIIHSQIYSRIYSKLSSKYYKICAVPFISLACHKKSNLICVDIQIFEILRHMIFILTFFQCIELKQPTGQRQMLENR